MNFIANDLSILDCSSSAVHQLPDILIHRDLQVVEGHRVFQASVSILTKVEP